MDGEYPSIIISSQTISALLGHIFGRTSIDIIYGTSDLHGSNTVYVSNEHIDSAQPNV